MEATELFAALESNQPQVLEETKKKFHELFNSCNPNDAWLVNGLFDYSMQTGSLRTVEILVGIREPHDTHLFNKFCESLRNQNKLQGLTLLGHLVRRQPPWLYKIARHNLFRDLLRLLRSETEVIPLMSALLVVNILLPLVAGLMEPYLQDIFHVFSHLAVWDAANPGRLLDSHLLHLQMALYALFLRLYGMYPCNFLSYLRQEYSQPQKKAVFNHTIKPMLDNVKIHPLLVSASKEFETTPQRWRRLEPHDIVVECAKLAFTGGGEGERPRDDSALRPCPDFTQIFDQKYGGRSSSTALSDKEVWSPSAFTGLSTPPESAPTSIPHTPIAQSHIITSSFPAQEGTSPPEAAVEATPETTPIKDLRSLMRGPPSNSNVPRALTTIASSPGQSQPSSPMRKDPSPFRFPSNPETSAFHQPPVDGQRESFISQKVQRIVTDRGQLGSEGAEGKVKPRGLLQPTSPLRVIEGPRLGYESPADASADQDDKEVEIMMTADNNGANWTPRQCDSVVQDIATHVDQDELEECHEESCAVTTGLRMPNSTSMRDFTRQVKSRLRYYSQCHGDAPCPGLSAGSSPSESGAIPINARVRRANSCPEMKKASSSLDRHPVEKVDEEPSPVNGYATAIPELPIAERQTSCVATQTDNPLPYEHLFLAVFPTVDHTHHAADEASSGLDTGHSSPLPTRRVSPNEVDLFMNTYSNIVCDTKKNKLSVDVELRYYKEQLLLMGLQLHFEKHRREMHAERNRRLLGKCRAVRSQEELTDALKDQLSLLQSENEALHSILHQRIDEAKVGSQQLQAKISFYQIENADLQEKLNKEKSLRLFAEDTLKQERDKTAAVTRELNEMKATLFVTTADLQHMTGLAREGRELRDTVASLQRELLVGAEVQERQRQRVADVLGRLSHVAETRLAQDSQVMEANALHQAMEAQTAALEATRARVGELEAQLARRESAVAEVKRLLQESKEEYQEQLQAVETKYQCLRAINTRLEAEIVQLQHQVSGGSQRGLVFPAVPPAPPPGAFHTLHVGDTSPPAKNNG